jgi:hypothetical protein
VTKFEATLLFGCCVLYGFSVAMTARILAWLSPQAEHKRKSGKTSAKHCAEACLYDGSCGGFVFDEGGYYKRRVCRLYAKTGLRDPTHGGAGGQFSGGGSGRNFDKAYVKCSVGYAALSALLRVGTHVVSDGQDFADYDVRLVEYAAEGACVSPCVSKGELARLGSDLVAGRGGVGEEAVNAPFLRFAGEIFMPLFCGASEVFHETPVKSAYEFPPANLYLAIFPPPEPWRCSRPAAGAAGARRSGGAACTRIRCHILP